MSLRNTVASLLRRGKLGRIVGPTAFVIASVLDAVRRGYVSRRTLINGDDATVEVHGVLCQFVFETETLGTLPIGIPAQGGRHEESGLGHRGALTRCQQRGCGRLAWNGYI